MQRISAAFRAALSLAGVTGVLHLPPLAPPQHHLRIGRRRRLKTGDRYRSNGKRECARRRAQIANGRLTQANGVAA